MEYIIVENLIINFVLPLCNFYFLRKKLKLFIICLLEFENEE